MSESGERRRRRELERTVGDETGAQPTAAPEWLTSAVPTSPTGARPASPGSRRAMRLAATTPSGAMAEVPDGTAWTPRAADPATSGNGTPAWASAPRTDAQPVRRSVLDGHEQRPASSSVTTARGTQLPAPAEPPVLPARPTTSAAAPPSSPAPVRAPAQPQSQALPRRGAWAPVPAEAPAAPRPAVPGTPAAPVAPPPFAAAPPTASAAPAVPAAPNASVAPAPPTAPTPVVPPAPGGWFGGAAGPTPGPAAPAAGAAGPASVPAAPPVSPTPPGLPAPMPRVGSWAVTPPVVTSSDDEDLDDADDAPLVLAGHSPFPSTGVTQVAAPVDRDDDEPVARRHPYTWLHVIVLAVVAFVLGFLIVALWNQGRNGAEGNPGTSSATAVETSLTGSSSAS